MANSSAHMSLRAQEVCVDVEPLPPIGVTSSCASGPPSVAHTEAGSVRGRLGSASTHGGGSPDRLHTLRRDSVESAHAFAFSLASLRDVAGATAAALPPGVPSQPPTPRAMAGAMAGAVDVGSVDHSPLAFPSAVAFARSLPWSSPEPTTIGALPGGVASHSPFGTGGIQNEHPDVVKARLLLERFAAVSQAVATPPAARALTSTLLREHTGAQGEAEVGSPASDGASTKAGASSTVAPSPRSSCIFEGPASHLQSTLAVPPPRPGIQSPLHAPSAVPRTPLGTGPLTGLPGDKMAANKVQLVVGPPCAVRDSCTAPRRAPPPRRATIWATAVEVDGDADVPQWLDITPTSYRAGVAAACVHAVTLIICGVACAFAMPRSATLPKAIVDVGPDCDPRVGTALSWLAGLLLPVGAMVFGWVLFVDLFVFPLLRSDAARFSLFRSCKRRVPGERHMGGSHGAPPSHFDGTSDVEGDGELGLEVADARDAAPATPVMPNAAATTDRTVSVDDAPAVAVPTVRGSATAVAPHAGCAGRKSHEASLVVAMTPGSGLVVGPGGVLASASQLGRRDLRTPVVAGLHGPVGHPERARALRATQHLRHYTLFVLSTGFLVLLLLASAGSALYVWIAATAAWRSEPCGRSYQTLRGASAVVVVEAVAIVVTHIAFRTVRFCRAACVSAPPLAAVVARR